MIICLLCAIAGVSTAFWAPLVQFAAGLLATAVAGAVAAIASGVPVGPAFLWSLAFYASAQIGYALGVLIIAVYRGRRQGHLAPQALPPIGESLFK